MSYVQKATLAWGARKLRTRVLFLAIPLFIGMVLGVCAMYVPALYLAFGICGLIYAYLVFFKIEIAIIIALLIQNQLLRFNYMGGGTPFHPNGLMGIAIIAGAAFYFMTHKVDFSRFRAIGGFALYMGVGVVSLINTGGYLMDGVTIALRLLTAFSIYAVLSHKLDSITKVKWVIGAVIAAQIIPTVTGLLMSAGKTGFVFNDETMRLGNSGVGVYMAIVSTLCLVFFLSARSNRNRILWGAATVLFLAGLFFSYGRSGWIGFAIAVMLMSMIRFKKLIFIIPLALILVVLLVPGITQRFADISFDNQVGSSDSTFSQRLEYWQAALVIFRSHPILGAGLGVGRYVVGDYRGLYPVMIHNDYVSALLETGILGLVVFLFWHYQWLTELFKTLKVGKVNLDRTISLAVLIVITIVMVMRLTDNILLDSFDMYPLCAIVAATLAIPRIRQAEAVNAGQAAITQ